MLLLSEPRARTTARVAKRSTTSNAPNPRTIACAKCEPMPTPKARNGATAVLQRADVKSAWRRGKSRSPTAGLPWLRWSRRQPQLARGDFQGGHQAPVNSGCPFQDDLDRLVCWLVAGCHRWYRRPLCRAAHLVRALRVSTLRPVQGEQSICHHGGKKRQYGMQGGKVAVLVQGPRAEVR
jgi:hypothetical protein